VRAYREDAFGRRRAPNPVALTGEARQQFAPREARTIQQVGGMLGRLSESEQRQLIGAMQTIKKILAPEVPYAQEYGYDEEFEAFTGEIVAKFIRHHDAKRERCWIAEKGGEVVGSVFLVAKSRTTAKIEPSARGLGSGSRLVDECVRFAPQAGYRKNGAVDAERTRRGAAHLEESWISRRGEKTASQLRQKSRRGNLGAFFIG
jgi:GNAT superfamily N-acetyltransferase